MENSTTSEQYTFTTENIRFPTFNNKEYEAEIMLPVTIDSFIKEITSFLEMVFQLENTYLDLFNSNIHQLTTLLSQVDRVPLCYIFLIKELYRMTMLMLAKVKAQFNLDTTAIDQYKNQTMDDVIASFASDERISKLVDEYYPDKSKIKDLLSWILEREFNVIKSDHRTGLTLLSNILKYSKILMTEINEQISKFKSIEEYDVKDKKAKILNEIIFLDMVIHLDNVKIISASFHNGYLVDENDICNLPEESKQWENIKKIMVRVVSKDEEAIIKESKIVNDQYPFMSALAKKGFKSKSNFNNFFTAIHTVVDYKQTPLKAIRDYKKSVIDVNDLSFVTMVNLHKVGFMKSFAEMNYPKIKYRQKFYLKRLEKEITLDYIKEILDHVEKDPNTPITLPQIEKKEEDDIYFEKVAKKKKKDFVSTRLIHCLDITTKKDLSNLFFKISKKPATNTTRDSLIIYIHGGGFIGGTTYSNESYARKWVKQLQMPLIGIDYGLSPQNQYPRAVDDAWQAYLWILKHAKGEWQIDPKHIVLTGDSAGASICLSLTYLLIIHGIKLPDILILNYPACESDMDSMTNSQLLVHKSALLHYKFLSFCIGSYVGKYNNKNDYILNHFKAPKEILKKLPKTAFLIGSADVLRDGSLRIIEKISECDIDCKVYEFKELGHGFFNWDKPAIINHPMDIFIKEVNNCYASFEKSSEFGKGKEIEKEENINK